MAAEIALFPLETVNPRPEEPSGELFDACTAMFSDLDAAKLLGPVEKAMRPVMLKAAAALDRALSAPTLTVAASNALKQYLEGLDKLPRPAGNDDLDALEMALMAATGRALNEVYPNE